MKKKKYLTVWMGWFYDGWAKQKIVRQICDHKCFSLDKCNGCRPIKIPLIKGEY